MNHKCECLSQARGVMQEPRGSRVVSKRRWGKTAQQVWATHGHSEHGRCLESGEKAQQEKIIMVGPSSQNPSIRSFEVIQAGNDRQDMWILAGMDLAL